MSTETSLITAEQFTEMHFDVPVELVCGEVVYFYGEDGVTRPDRRHGGICSHTAIPIGNWEKPRKTGRVTTNDSATRTIKEPDTIRGANRPQQ